MSSAATQRAETGQEREETGQEKGEAETGQEKGEAETGQEKEETESRGNLGNGAGGEAARGGKGAAHLLSRGARPARLCWRAARASEASGPAHCSVPQATREERTIVM